MFRYLFAFILVLFVLTDPTITFAQNSNGNYYQGHLPAEGDYVISTWRVVATSGLNCRSKAGTEFNVVKRFAQGDRFSVSTSEGRDQHNNPVELDKQGLPWFRLTEKSGGCRVRATSQYIAPEYTPS
ncbi:SH3 domain-containing protein [Pantanalinema rosaneae CENA516]|uniref:SH3 domain-containing protein n=1 Tax=Pantanalinema rosaneae TaxID=1620701 RepID=UPI003D6FE16A